MNLKQRISILTAAALPLLALGYLVISPPKAHASSDCPTQTYSDNEGAGNTCGDGHDEGVSRKDPRSESICSSGQFFLAT